MDLLGIDIGATGIKGTIVNIETGTVFSDKIKYDTPNPATPIEVCRVVKYLINDFNWQGKSLGMGFPAIIKEGISYSASNIDNSWLNFDIKKYFESELKASVEVINDADAAGIAEMQFGSCSGQQGTALLLTLGTGIGSAVFVDGKLVPNTEFGHLRYKKSVVEHYASNRARVNKELSWESWAKELDKVLNYMNLLLSPDLIVIGGGISKRFKKFEEFLTVNTRVIPAKLLNNAGIIGAAYTAYKRHE